MTRAEVVAYNRGVLAVLDIAAHSADVIRATSQRPVAEAFAVAALTELAEACRVLLISTDAEQPLEPPSIAE